MKIDLTDTHLILNGRKHILPPNFEIVSDDFFKECQQTQFPTEFNQKVIDSEFLGLAQGRSLSTHIDRKYVNELRYQTVYSKASVSVWDVYHNKTLLSYVFWTAKKYPMYDDTPDNQLPLVSMRCGTCLARNISNYPLTSVRTVLDQFNVNNHYYDYSCGWGARLLASISYKSLNGGQFHYYGTDPNYKLTPKLEQMAQDYKTAVTTFATVSRFNQNKPEDKKQKVLSPDDVNTWDIRTQGSEVFVPDWENTMGVAFSSPPYFDLEDYGVGAQSVTEDTSYDMWLNDYWKGTMANIDRYLIPGGVMILNIKNSPKYKLEDDCGAIIKSFGYVEMDTIQLENKENDTIDTGGDENIHVFCRENETPTFIRKKVIDLGF